MEVFRCCPSSRSSDRFSERFSSFSEFPCSSERTRPKRADLAETSLFTCFREGRALRARTEIQAKFAARVMMSDFREHLKLQRKSIGNRSKIGPRTSCAKKTRFLQSRTPLGVHFGRPAALPDACDRPFWRPGTALATLRALPGRAGDAPGRSRDAPETPSGRSRAPRVS